MSNIVAGIGRGQMEVIDERVTQRRANNQKYREFFKGVAGITFQNEPNDDFFSNYWLTAILINPQLTGGINREMVRLQLEDENIESRPLWKPMHLQPIYEGTKFFGKGVCEKLFNEGLCLPSGSNLTVEEFDRIFSASPKYLKNRNFLYKKLIKPIERFNYSIFFVVSIISDYFFDNNFSFNCK